MKHRQRGCGAVRPAGGPRRFQVISSARPPRALLPSPRHSRDAEANEVNDRPRSQPLLPTSTFRVTVHTTLSETRKDVLMGDRLPTGVLFQTAPSPNLLLAMTLSRLFLQIAIQFDVFHWTWGHFSGTLTMRWPSTCSCPEGPGPHFRRTTWQRKEGKSHSSVPAARGERGSPSPPAPHRAGSPGPQPLTPSTRLPNYLCSKQTGRCLPHQYFIGRGQGEV